MKTCAVTFLIALQFLAWNKPEWLCVSSKTKNKLETDMAAVLSCDVQSVSSFQCHACCVVGKTMDFPGSKNKHKQMSVLEPFDDSCMWKEFQTCRHFSQFRIVGYPPFTLFAHRAYGPSCTLRVSILYKATYQASSNYCARLIS